MLILLFSLLAGLGAGWLLRRWPVRRLDRVTTVLVWVLLFLLGLEAGGNTYLMQRLPALGMEALWLTAGGLSGSVLFTRWFTNWIDKKGGRP